MRYTGSWMNAVVLLALVATGCRLPFRDGSVPQSVTDCRRLSQQGVAALERGQQESAETLLAKAVAACPVDGEARRHYAEALWRRGAHKEAIAQLQQSSRLIGEDAELSVRLAEMQLADKQIEPARQNAEQALALDPKLPGAWAIRGAVMRAAGQPQQALADDLRALGYAPGDRTILLEIAELHRQLNQPDRALHALQTLADTYSPGEEPGGVLYLMGMAYRAMGRLDDSLESLKSAVARGKPTPEMFHELGEAQLLAGHPAEAAEAARQALAIQPQHQPSRDLLDRTELAQRPQGLVK